MEGTQLLQKRAFWVGACLGRITSRFQSTFHPVHLCWIPEGDIIWTHKI